MAYSDFKLDQVVETFGLSLRRVDLFSAVQPQLASSWLQETLDISLALGLASGSEKARSEFIITPILLEIVRHHAGQLALHSGKSLNADFAQGLAGECDFLLSLGELSDIVQAPVLAIVEAKKQDIESGIGQCAAQLVGALRFNQVHQRGIGTLFGCVTTGEAWQFLRLQEVELAIARSRLYINELPQILGMFQAIVAHFLTPATPPERPVPT